VRSSESNPTLSQKLKKQEPASAKGEVSATRFNKLN
jgi:hypothetical protein